MTIGKIILGVFVGLMLFISVVGLMACVTTVKIAEETAEAINETLVQVPLEVVEINYDVSDMAFIDDKKIEGYIVIKNPYNFSVDLIIMNAKMITPEGYTMDLIAFTSGNMKPGEIRRVEFMDLVDIKIESITAEPTAWKA